MPHLAEDADGLLRRSHRERGKGQGWREREREDWVVQGAQ